MMRERGRMGWSVMGMWMGAMVVIRKVKVL